MIKEYLWTGEASDATADVYKEFEGVPRGEKRGGTSVRDALGPGLALAVSPNRRHQGVRSLDCDIAEGKLGLWSGR